MATYERSTQTKATPDRVWRIWSDVSTWPDWNPDVISIDIEGPFASGTRGEMRTRAGGTHAITLVDVVPGRSFQLETAALPLTRFAFRCEVRPGGPGAAVISQSITVRGPLGPILGPVMGDRIARGFEPLLDGLRSAAESGGAA